MSFIPSFIKSVQYGSITFGGVDFAKDYILPTAVDANYAVVQLTGISSTNPSNAGLIQAGVELAATGLKVTARRAANGLTPTAYFTVIEFYPIALKQVVQHFRNVAFAATYAIAAVGTKAFVVPGGGTTLNGFMSIHEALMIGEEITSSVLVTQRANSMTTISFAVVDPR